MSTNFTAADLASWDGYVDTMRGLGVLNVAPAIVGSGTILDIAHTDATAFLRSAALYGGGIDIDMTPSAILGQGGSAMTALVDDLQWAAGEGLRTTLTLRAYSDASFLQNTQTLLGRLQAAGALPSQVVVVGSAASSTIPSAELANSVAQYVSTLALTPGSAESGLASTGKTGGANGSGVDAIMTGVRSSETVTGPASHRPLCRGAGVQRDRRRADDGDRSTRQHRTRHPVHQRHQHRHRVRRRLHRHPVRHRRQHRRRPRRHPLHPRRRRHRNRNPQPQHHRRTRNQSPGRHASMFTYT